MFTIVERLVVSKVMSGPIQVILHSHALEWVCILCHKCIYSIAHLSVQSACYHCRDSFPWVEYCEEWLMVSKVVAMQLLIKILLFLSENSSFHCLTMSWKHTLCMGLSVSSEYLIVIDSTI